MAVTVTANLTVLDNCDAINTWTGSPSLDTDVKREGTGCLGKKVSNTQSRHYETVSPIDLSNNHIYVWFMITTTAILDTKANSGIEIFVGDGSNTGYWNVGGNDNYRGGWQCYVINTDRAFDSGSCTLTVVTQIGIGFKTTGKVTGNVSNCFWDVIRYGSGLIIKGGTSGDRGSWNEIAVDDTTNAYGIVEEVEGIFYVQGALIFGDTAADSYFEDKNAIIVFRDALVSSSLYDIKLEGYASGTNSFILGDLTSGIVSGGCVFKSASATLEYTITVTDDNVDECFLYACKLTDSSTVNFGNSSTEMTGLNLKVQGTVFEDCGTVSINATNSSNLLQDDVFINSSDTAALIIFELHVGGILSSQIVGNTRGIEIQEANTILIKEITFSDNTTDVYFSTAATATLNAIDCTDNFIIAQSVNWNCYEKTTYNAHTDDELGSNLATVTIRMADQYGTQDFVDATDGSGDLAEKQIKRRSRVYTGSLATTNHNPFQLRMRKYDYVPQEMSKAFGAVAVTDSFALLDDDYASTASGTVAGWSSDITINEGTTPDRIELSTTSHSLTEVYEYMRYYTAQSANMDLTDPIITADGVKFINNDHDFQVDTVTLTGAALELSMSTKDFTLISGGSQGLKKLTDTDGTQVSLQLENVIIGSRCYIETDEASPVQLMSEVATSSTVSEPYVHVSDKNLTIRVRKSYIIQIIPFQVSGYISCVDSDIGKNVTDDGGGLGLLVAFNNATRIWYVDSTSQVGNGSVMDIPTGSGAGTTNADSTQSEKYIPFLGGGTVTSDGFTGNVSQVEDTIA